MTTTARKTKRSTARLSKGTAARTRTGTTTRTPTRTTKNELGFHGMEDPQNRNLHVFAAYPHERPLVDMSRYEQVLSRLCPDRDRLVG